MRVPIVGVWSTGRLGFTQAWDCMMEVLPALGIPVVRGTGGFWGQGMERAMTLAIARLQPEWLLCLDHDSVWQRSDVVELLRLAQESGEIDALCPLQWHRSEDRPLGALLDGSSPAGEPGPDELVELRSGHFGLTLLRAAAVARMKHPWFHAVPDEQGEWGPGRTDDDVFFWRRLRAHGGRIWLAPHVAVGHMELGIRWPGTGGTTRWQTLADWGRQRGTAPETSEA